MATVNISSNLPYLAQTWLLMATVNWQNSRFKPCTDSETCSNNSHISCCIHDTGNVNM